MLRKFLYPLLVTLLFLPTMVQAQDMSNEMQSLGARNSRHIFIPFLGYVGMNGEDLSSTMTITYLGSRVGVDTNTVTSTSTLLSERDVNAPFLGVLYRFRVTHQLHMEASYAIAHDRMNREHRSKVEIVGFPFYHKISVIRTNTNMATAGAGILLPVWKNVIAGGATISGGYAWRDVKVEIAEEDIELVQASAFDADAMYVIKGGVKGSIWRGNQFLIEMAVDYTHFVPTDSDIDAFGGISWRASVFPIWFGN
ncbi:hypothetical protein ACFLQV_02025 [Calditrichota bacterium]